MNAQKKQEICLFQLSKKNIKGHSNKNYNTKFILRSKDDLYDILIMSNIINILLGIIWYTDWPFIHGRVFMTPLKKYIVVVNHLIRTPSPNWYLGSLKKI